VCYSHTEPAFIQFYCKKLYLYLSLLESLSYRITFKTWNCLSVCLNCLKTKTWIQDTKSVNFVTEQVSTAVSFDELQSFRNLKASKVKNWTNTT